MDTAVTGDDEAARGVARDAARIAAEIVDAGTHTDPFVAAVRATRMPMCITDPRLPDNPIVFANDSFCRLTGYSRDEVLGRNCRFLQGPASDPAAIAAIRTAVAAQEPLTVDVLNYRKTGEAFWVRLLIGPVFDADHELAYYFSSQLDITPERERVAALETDNASLADELAARLAALSASEGRLRVATEAGRLGLWEVDLTTYDLAASPIFRENFGFPRDAPMTNADARAAVHPDDRDRVLAAVRATLATGERFDAEFRVLRPDGAGWVHQRAEIVSSADGTPLRIAGTSLDITARRAADAALAASEERLRVATEAAAVAVWEISLPDLVLTGTPTLNAVYGQPPGPTPPYALIRGLAHPDDAAWVLAAFNRAIAGDGDYDVTYRVRRDDGGYGWVEVRGQISCDETGTPTRILGVSQDVTARRAAEAELALSAESLRLATAAANVGTWDLDLTTDVLTWDALTKGMFGLSPDAPCTMADFYAGLHPDDGDATLAAFAASLDPAVRALYDVEYRTIGREDGVVRWVAARGKGLFAGDVCVRAIGTAIDITRTRRSARHQAALLALTDRVRALADPSAIIDTAMVALGREIGACRVGYAQVNDDDTTAHVRTPFVDGVAPLDGQFVLGTFGAGTVARTRAGDTVVIPDVTGAAGVDADAMLAVGTRAFAVVPQIRDGRLRANLFVHRAATGAWDADDIALIEEVAARTWEAVERTRAEAERQASEARLRAVVEAAPVGLIFASADGAIVGGNAQVERLLRHPVLPSPGVAQYDEYVAFHADGRQVAGHEYPLARALAGEERPELEPLYRRGDGSLAYLRFIAAPVRGPDGAVAGAVVASLDVDRERRTELRQRLFLTLADRVRNLPDPRAITAATADVLGRHLGVSRVGFADIDDAAGTVTHDSAFADGVDPTLGTFPLDAFGRGNIAELRDGVTTVMSDVTIDPRAFGADFAALGTRAAMAVPLVRDGRLRAVLYVNHHAVRDWRTDEVTLVEEVAARTWDAVERARAEAALRDLNATLERRVAETAAARDAVWRESRDMLLIIRSDGVIEAVNPAWTATLGYAAEQLIGRRYSDFLADDVGVSDAALATIPTAPLRDFENRYRHADGSLRDFAWTAGAGEDGRMYCVARDITEQKAAARELETAQEALRQAQKMEAVGQLTGGIAHDFNNMLAVVLGSLDLLGRRLGDDDARARRYVEAATDGARRAATLTQRLLAFSRRQPLQPEPIDVNRLVAGMSDLLRGSLGGGVQLETVLAGGLWPVHADPNQLENVILNLGINARDAMGGDGRVTIETANAHLDDRYVAAEIGVAAGQYVLVAVTDAGAGMSADVIAKAFDPFFTTKGVGKGTGLGLSQVYGFVRQSGGHVKIYSEVGVGTTVKLYLPRRVGDALPAPADADPAPVGGDAHELILVVEDEPGVRAVSVESLRELGYRVLEADCAATALRLLESNPDVALMFTDIVMPEVNGAKLAEAARALRPGLKILFTTGYTRNAVVHNGIVDPGTDLIGKPFTVDALASKVRSVLDGT